MLNYPKDGDTIVVSNISCKSDCRAYRVFKYYIKQRARDLLERLHARDSNSTAQEALSRIFLCDPQPGGGCRVFTCPSCKALSKRSHDGKVSYKQSSVTRLDFFDGHSVETGEYGPIGIGEKQADEYAVLNVHDRMALSVLKVCPTPHVLCLPTCLPITMAR